MSARDKLNAFHLNMIFGISTVLGILTDSPSIFVISLLLLGASRVLTGAIRPVANNRRRRK